MAKIDFAAFNEDLCALRLDRLGAEGMVGSDFTFRRPDVYDETGSSRGVPHAFLRVRAKSIEGGTSEILRNVLAEQVLSLPREPRRDKDLPWAEIPRN